jgi:hypothetical protein
MEVTNHIFKLWFLFINSIERNIDFEQLIVFCDEENVIFCRCQCHRTYRECWQLIRLIKLSDDLFANSSVSADTRWLIIIALIECEHTVAPTNDESVIVRHNASDLSSIIPFNECVKFAAIFTNENLTLVSANYKTGSVLDPCMANEACEAVLSKLTPVNIVQLTVVKGKLCVCNFEVLVSIWSCDNNWVLVVRIERTLETGDTLGVRKADTYLSLNLSRIPLPKYQHIVWFSCQGKQMMLFSLGRKANWEKFFWLILDCALGIALCQGTSHFLVLDLIHRPHCLCCSFTNGKVLFAWRNADTCNSLGLVHG